MKNIEYVNGNRELLEAVKPLWEKLNEHHKNNSTDFSEVYEAFTFEDRSKKFYSSEIGNVNIELVKDAEKGKFIGYCISTISKEFVGEIDSLYIDNDYRSLGIGDNLMERAIQWLDNNNVKKKIIGVAAGNEKVLEFYKRHGFYKRTTILEQKW